MAEELTDKRRERLAKFVSPLRVKPDTKVTLPEDFDPAFKGGLAKEEEGQKLLREGVELLSTFQARLAAQDTWGVLVVLQAIDAAGKDGTIRRVDRPRSPLPLGGRQAAGRPAGGERTAGSRSAGGCASRPQPGLIRPLPIVPTTTCAPPPSPAPRPCPRATSPRGVRPPARD